MEIISEGMPATAPAPQSLPRFADGTINLQEFIRSMAELLTNEIMSAEADQLCGSTVNSRNGFRERKQTTCVGTLTLRTPKLRSDSFFPADIIEHRNASVMNHQGIREPVKYRRAVVDPELCEQTQHRPDIGILLQLRRHTPTPGTLLYRVGAIWEQPTLEHEPLLLRLHREAPIGDALLTVGKIVLVPNSALE